MMPGALLSKLSRAVYSRGGNRRPPAFETAALANQIQPLDAAGLPNGAGKIVLLSIGMCLVTAELTAGHLTMSFPRAKLANGATITVEAAGDTRSPCSSSEQSTGDGPSRKNEVARSVGGSYQKSLKARFLRGS